MAKYHINPTTGMPGRCTAKLGNCPYGGKENHYSSYSEAFEKSQINLKDSYRLLPNNLNQVDKETQDALDEQALDQARLDADVNKVNKNVDIWAKKVEVSKSKDPNFLSKVVDGSLDPEGNWAMIGAALKNPYIPRTILNEAIYDKLNVHNEIYTRYTMLNSSLTTEDINHVVENANDYDTRLLAYMHPSLDKKTIMSFIKNRPNDIITYPYHGMLENKSHREDPDIRDWRLGLIKKGISPFFPKNSEVYNKYN